MKKRGTGNEITAENKPDLIRSATKKKKVKLQPEKN